MASTMKRFREQRLSRGNQIEGMRLMLVPYCNIPNLKT